MEMIGYAFALGLSFIAGLAFGGWLLGRMVNKEVAHAREVSTEQREMILAHYTRVEDRLDGYVEVSREIAATLKQLVRSNTKYTPPERLERYR